MSYANVMSTLAVVIAVAGGTTAIAASVGKNTVTTKSIRPGNVTARDLADVRVVTHSIGPFVRDDRVTCAANEKLIGGGAQLVDQDEQPPAEDPPAALEDSYPDGNSWVVSTTASGTGAVYALCLSAKASKGK